MEAWDGVSLETPIDLGVGDAVKEGGRGGREGREKVERIFLSDQSTTISAHLPAR